jgi:hypothetical protein
MTYCRICEQEIPYEEWKDHTKRHRIDFCIKYRLDTKYLYEVEWENVVRAFNPEKAKPRPEELKALDPQKPLTKFIEIGDEHNG